MCYPLSRLTTLLLFVALGGCDLAPGRPFSWKSTVDTEFDIPAGDSLAFGSYQFGEAFQIGSVPSQARCKSSWPRAAIGTVPRQIGLNFQQFDQSGLNLKASYGLSAPLKMQPFGAGYKLTYKFSDKSIPALNFSQFDFVQMSVQPQGGSIGTGWRVSGAYAFIPHS